MIPIFVSRHLIIVALTCRELIELLGEYHSGELAPGLRVSADAHLLDCTECTDYLRSYETTIRLAKASGRSSPEPPDSPDDLVQAILYGGAKRKRRII